MSSEDSEYQDQGSGANGHSWKDLKAKPHGVGSKREVS
jgi:hypothetical protein